MNGKQARALRKIAQLNTTDTTSSKVATKIIKQGYKQFKRSDIGGRSTK